MDRTKVTNDYLQIGQTKVQYSVRKVTENGFFISACIMRVGHVFFWALISLGLTCIRTPIE